MLDTAMARLAGAYALRAYLPISLAARTFRCRLRQLRGKTVAPVKRLPQASWSQVLKNRPIQLAETAKSDGNVRLSELAVLALAAAHAFRQRNHRDRHLRRAHGAQSRDQCAARRFDRDARSSADQPSAFAIEESERRYVDKPAPGGACVTAAGRGAAMPAASSQLHGDSATFDWSPHLGRAGLVFVDGSHAYDYARMDSETAMRPGETGRCRALARLRCLAGRHAGARGAGGWRGRLGLVNIRGTSLVFWRAPYACPAAAGQVSQDPLHVPGHAAAS